MITFTKIIVRIGFWMQAFAGPFLVFAAIAFFIYSNNPKNELIAYMVSGFGIIAGIAFAEFIRRNYGLDLFFSGNPQSAAIDKKVSSKK